MDFQKIDLILQYALLVAGESDEFFDRELSPIHLIKYVYIADLAHAERHQGETFTGVKWKFHKFGPWSVEVFKRIEPALTSLGATKKIVSHPKCEDDFTHWSITNEEMVSGLAALLPLHMEIAVRQAVHAFRADTASLLNHVYLTKPMLKAAPGEDLDLSVEKEGVPPQDVCPEEPKLTIRQAEEQKKKLQDLRERMRERLKKIRKQPSLVPANPPPRYDDVFAAGQEWLDSLAGFFVEEEEGKTEFSEEIWKSPARYDPDLS